ncbi:unnamed protein product [Candida verbasci]|uniref:Mitochondrial outer membrane protein OM14 C-terminal domain-containing protein n=1 Tax=Candida verbasci TaxID=1227364 RepID=A0A9W4TST8_9ASCO|nr:unnamed protein product [Candida verbasci]
MTQGKAPSNEQIKKDLKRDADNVAKKAEEKSEELAGKSKQESERLQKQGKEFLNDASEKGNELYEEAKKEFNHLENEGKDLFSKLYGFLNEKAQCASQQFSKFSTQLSKNTKDLSNRLYLELQNPVVLTQLVVIAGGAAAAYQGYLERHRIRSENNVVLGLHASIITGLVLVDGFLFNKYYPKYDPKTTTFYKKQQGLE